MTEITRPQLAVAAAVVALVAWFGARALLPARPVVPTTGAAVSADGDGRAGGGTAASGARDPGAEEAAGGGPASGEPGTGTATLSRPAGEVVVVHVAGAVRRPGVYRLRDGDRVADAIARAGGRARGADLDAVNLAAEAKDGVQILIPRRAAGGGAGGSAGAAAGVAGATAASGGGTGAAGAGSGGVGAGGGAVTGGTGATAGAGAGGPIIDLNRATAVELETLDGVGPATAAKILEWRAQHGAFRSVDDLEQIPGIGPKKLAAMRPRVRV